MNIAVSGAGGFLGRVLLAHLQKAGHKTLAFSNSLERAPNVKPWSVKQSWAELSKMLEGVDVFIHAAAYIPENIADPDEAEKCVEINALGTLTLLRAAEAAGVRRFILISGTNVLATNNSPVNEDSPYGNARGYSYLASKMLAEVYVNSFDAKNMSVLTVRPSSIYGQGNTRGVLSLLANKLSSGQEVTLAQGGSFRSDFVWCEDLGTIIGRIAESDKTGFVNLGSGDSKTALEAANLIAGIVGASSDLIIVEKETHAEAQYPSIDISRARQWFNFNPAPLEEGLRQWLRNAT